MFKKNPLMWGLCLFFCLVAMPLSATTISVQIVQMDDANEDVTDSSLIIEESIMDYMFSQGYIVSNSPIIYSKEKAQNGMIVSLVRKRTPLFFRISSRIRSPESIRASSTAGIKHLSPV